MYTKLTLYIGIVLFSTSCVSSKTFKEEQAKAANFSVQLDETKSRLDQTLTERDDVTLQRNRANQELEKLKDQVNYLSETNKKTLQQVQELSAMSASQAESIRKSLENIGTKDGFIQGLQIALARRDSVNMQLMIELREKIGGQNDIRLKTDGGFIQIEIADELLFRTNRVQLAANYKATLDKIAPVLQKYTQMDFIVEGYTDNTAFKNSAINDNWELSVKRAALIVKELQDTYNINPLQLAASGRGEYKPASDNTTNEGRASNRRITLKVVPQVDAIQQLLIQQPTALQ